MNILNNKSNRILSEFDVHIVNYDIYNFRKVKKQNSRIFRSFEIDEIDFDLLTAELRLLGCRGRENHDFSLGIGPGILVGVDRSNNLIKGPINKTLNKVLLINDQIFHLK
jgi:hypothetical protein